MSYNNGFPVGYPQITYPQFPQNYPQPYQNAYMPQTQPQTQQVNNLPPVPQSVQNSPKFDVVQGELAANMYQTENGQEVILIDMDNPYIYKKRRGLDGKVEPMEKFELVKVEDNPQQPQINLDGYVKREQLADLIADAVKDEVEKKLSEMTLKPSTRRSKAEE